MSSSSSHTTSSTPFTNRLQHETSPYLLQHMHNPVDWYPWGEEAFKKAKEEDKPIFLSIGYSSCHWCHVMEHESFADPTTANLMNKYFVNIKVDREERPDVDRVYMSFVQATTGSGGWPLSAFLTPDLKPIFGGTYFPRESHMFSRMPSFTMLLTRIHALWIDPKKRQQLISQSEQVMNVLANSSQEGSSEDISVDKQEAMEEMLQQKVVASSIKRTAMALLSKFDKKLGGYGRAPKFPMPSNFEFVFRAMHFFAHEDASLKEQLQHSAIFTLHCMCRGGIYDHLGGGFHRYSVDSHWHVPHFEKMLYDNGQLLMSLASAYQITKDPIFAQVIQETIEYLERDMLYVDPSHAERCALYSAEDADSLPEETDTHKKEGAFYVWTRKELTHILQNNPTIQQSIGNEVNIVGFICDLFDVREDGNVADEQDPHGELTHQNVLIMRKPMKEVAAAYHLTEDRAWSIWRDIIKPILFTVRSRRPRPHLDDKVITSWNALAISGIARASLVCSGQKREHYLKLANSIASFLEHNMYNRQTKTVMRSYRKGKCVIEGYLDDYSFLIQALLDLYDANYGNETGMHWLRWALELQARQDELFGDKTNGGYFEVTGKDPSVLLRMKEEQDGAEPSGISVSVMNLSRLCKSHLVDEKLAAQYFQFAMLTVLSTRRIIEEYPAAVPFLLCGYDQLVREHNTPKKQLAIVYHSALEKEKDAVMEILFKNYLPMGIVHFIFVNVDQRDESIMQQAPYLREMVVKDNKPTFYLCYNYTCQLPTTNIEEVQSKL